MATDIKIPLVVNDMITSTGNNNDNRRYSSSEGGWIYHTCRTITDSPYWNIFLLALAWALTLTTSTLLTSVGPLTATEELGASG